MPRPTRRTLLRTAGVTAAAAVPAAAVGASAAPLERIRPVTPQTPASPDSVSPTPAERRRRARAAADALLTHFRAESDPDMLLERTPRQEGDPEFSYVWPLSQARAAVTEMIAGLDDPAPYAEADAALRRAQEHYWYPEGGTTGLPGYTAATDSRQGANGDFFYDDNDWIALLEIEQHLLTGGREGDLERVGQLLDLFRSGESTDPTLASPGGIEWTQGDWNHDRNTVSTFPSAKVALRWHALTGEETALEDALRWMAWGRDTLLAPNGLYWDNIKPDGEIDRTHWAYNQGVPLGCEVLAFEITGEKAHRARALDLVEAVLAHYRPFDEDSPLDAQPLQFTAILLSNLLLAESVLGARAQGRKITQAYADRLWPRRDPATDLVHGHETEEGTHLLDQSGFARALALAALPHPLWHHLS